MHDHPGLVDIEVVVVMIAIVEDVTMVVEAVAEGLHSAISKNPDIFQLHFIHGSCCPDNNYSFMIELTRYGSPYNTEWRVVVENLSTRAGWQVRAYVCVVRHDISKQSSKRQQSLI